MTEEEKREEDLGAARGIFWGTVLGTLIWVLVIVAIYYVTH